MLQWPCHTLLSLLQRGTLGMTSYSPKMLALVRTSLVICLFANISATGTWRVLYPSFSAIAEFECPLRKHDGGRTCSDSVQQMARSQ